MQYAIRKRLAAHAAAPAHGGMRPRRQDPIHPGARVGRPPRPKPHNATTGFQCELLAQEGSQVRSPEDHIAAREERVEGRDAKVRGHGFEGLNGDQGDCGIHVRGLAEKPVTDDALTIYDVHLRGISGGYVGGAITSASEVGVPW
jgi:hypothetical protein